MPGNEEVHAVVQKVCPDGKHGPYATATEERLGSITFSLDGSVWNEEGAPELGEIVVLSKLRKKRAGWKAMCGRRYRPSDEPSKEQ